MNSGCGRVKYPGCVWRQETMFLVCGGEDLESGQSGRETVGRAGAASGLQGASQLTSAPELGSDGDGEGEGG